MSQTSPLSLSIVAKFTLLSLGILFLASCRLVITTDGTGSIESASGLTDCSEDVCPITITGEFTETFTAIPADGYRFIRWQGVCNRTVIEECQVSLKPLGEEHSEFDGDVGLSAVFEPVTRVRNWYRDRDGDFFGSPLQVVRSAERPDGFVVNQLDCDDDDSTVFPWTKELDDGRDNNCNDKVDEGFVDTRYYLDNDGDGYGDESNSILARQAPEGYVRDRQDCNDQSATAYPGAEELLDGIDNDCDGTVDEGANTYFRDVDGDGYGTAGNSIESLEPVAGYVQNDFDCDDNNQEISPAANEIFDSADNDCDGAIDEGFSPRNYYADVDGDGYGDRYDSVWDIDQPAGYVTNSTDNCPGIANADQADIDGDGLGDACDDFTDSDRDGQQDSADNCPSVYNPSQRDEDSDGLGDACDSQNNFDLDNDGINAADDNCPDSYNPSQVDSDHDGLGDACDAIDDSGDGDLTVPCASSPEGQAMLEAVNAFRARDRSCGSRGDFPAVPALSWRCELESAALGHSMDMANNNFFSHTGFDGSSAGDRATREGYNWSSWGENIAAGSAYSAVSAVMQGWIDSPGHCANLMGASFTEFGAAKYSNSSSTYNVYWTQVFGRSR